MEKRMLKARWWRWCCALWLAVACGGCGERYGVRLQFADAALLAKIQAVDLVIYPSGAVNCTQLNSTNYTSSGAFGKDLIQYTPFRFQGDARRIVINDLKAGASLVLYFVGFENQADGSKRAVAEGCASGVTLTEGQITSLEVEMKAIP